MRKVRHPLVYLLVVVSMVSLVATAGLSGCSAGQKQQAEQKALRVGMWSEPKGLNPLAQDDAYSTQLYDFIYPKLFRWTHSMEPSPYLASSWEISPDGKTYTFHLNPAAKWEDGVPVTSKDVVMTIHLMANKATGALLYTNLQSIEGIDKYHNGETSTISGLQAPDDHTVVFNLKEPNAAFMGNLYYYILPEHILGKVAAADVATHEYFNKPIGAGPFKLVKYVTGQYAELVANDDFILGRPKIDRLFLQFGNQEAIMASLEKGDLDVGPISFTDVDRFKNIDRLNVVSQPSISIQMLHVNTQKPELKDVRVRQAIVYALDREGMVRTLLNGHGTVVDCHYLSPEWGVSPGLMHYARDVEKAKQLLSEVGWNPNRELVLNVPTGDKAREGSAAIIKANLEEVGIKVRIQQADFARTLKAAREGDFDLTIIGWPFMLDPDQTAIGFQSDNVPPRGWNVGHYKNNRVDELLALGRRETVLERRKAIYHEYQEILNRELPWIPLWAPNNVFGVTKKLVGLNPINYYVWGFMNPILWNIHELDIQQD